mgnify:CR=1 FL=1
MTNTINEMNFKVFPLTSLPDLPEFESLINLWNVTRGEALLPLWRNFLFDDLMPWIGRLAVTEYDGEEMHPVLFGGAFVELFGQEMTGKAFFQNLSPDERDVYHKHFVKIINGPCIGHSYGTFSLFNPEPKQISVIELPLADKEQSVSRILHALVIK